MEDLTKIPEVQSYFLEVDIYDQLKEVAKKHGLPEERATELLDLSDAVIKGKLDFKEMSGIIATAFGLDEKKAGLVAADVAGYHLLPLENYIRGLRKQIVAWGGKVEDYPDKRIGGEESNEDRFMKDFADRLDLRLPDHLMNRFVYLSKGYLSKKRTRESTAALMMRRLNIGGLELSAQQAEQALSMLDGEQERYATEIGGVGKMLSKDEMKAEFEVHGQLLKSAVAGSQDPVVSKKSPPVRPAGKTKSNIKSKPELQSKSTTQKPQPTTQRQDRSVGKRIMPEPRDLELEEPKTHNPQPTTHNLPKKEYLERKKPEKQGDQQAANDLLKPVVEAFRKKHIPRRAYRASVGALMRGQETEKDLRATLLEYNFEQAEIDDLVGITLKAKAVANGEESVVSSQYSVVDEKAKSKLPTKAVSHALVKEVPVISGSILDKDEEEELKAHAKTVKKLSKKTPDKFTAQVESALEDALKPVAEIFKKRRIARKVFFELAKAHVRGVREPIKTRQLLESKYGFKGDDLESIMKALEGARKQANQGSVDQKLPGGAWSGSAGKVEDTQQKEKELLDQKHAELTKKASEKSIELPQKNVRVSAARSKSEELAVQASKIDQLKVAAAEKAALPKPAKTKLSMPSVPPKSAAKITDVKFARRLMGPVEEIGSINVAAFRRLSSDAGEAVMKIEDKLDLLEQTSFEDRILGVKAWRQSAVNRLYIEMTQQSLQKGTSISEIATIRRNAGEETLTPAEITAIVALNHRIKF